MASLNGQTIASSYEQLLHVDRDGGGNDNTLVSVKDGDNGTTFGIKLATNKVEIIPGSNDANAFEVSQADGTAVFTVNTSTAGASVAGTLTTSDNVSIVKSNDGGDVSLTVKNSAGAGSTDETSSIQFTTTSSGHATAAVIGARQSNYNDSASRDGELKLQASENGSLGSKLILRGDNAEFFVQTRAIDGSESAPAYSFNNNTDMGMYRGASNTLRFATGGTERIEVQSSQTKISTPVKIATDNDSPLIFQKTSNGEMFTKYLDSSGTLKGALIYRTDTNAFSLRTNAITALDIDSSQNATFSGKILKVDNDTEAVIKARRGSRESALEQNSSGGVFTLLDSSGNTGAQISSYSQNFLVNNVSIGGTHTALTKLHIVGATGDPASSGTTPTAIARFDSTFNSVLDIGQGADPYPMFIQAADRSNLAQFYKLSLNPVGGNVGVGTLNPGEKFEAVGGNGVAIQVNNSSGDRDATFRMKCATNSQEIRMGLNVDNVEQHSFSIKDQASGTERLRIQANGDLRVTMNTTGFTAIKGSASVALADDASISVSVGDNQFIMISENTQGRGALFHCTFPQATPNELSDPNSIFSASDSDGNVCVFSSSNNSTVTIKNRLGAQHNFRIIVFGV